ncbi:MULTISPECIES: hypothetical protein [unclassified Nocardioides]|uniref:hypothetical protein n=1 Tax=unclassified Nocardioides TaxID=2615069 RepID=UPI00361175DE
MAASDERAPWWQRVLPVTGVAAALLALATLLVPGVREQVALSATHREQAWVELAFGREADGTLPVCRTGEKVVRVRFDVTSHLPEPKRLRYVVTVRGGGRTERDEGKVRVAPGDTTQTRLLLPRPAREYAVEVRLRGRDQALRAHCPEVRR